MNQQHISTHEKGMTLIELLVVIAILAISSSLLIWGYSQTPAAQGSDVAIGKEVIRNWTVMALSDEGALITVKDSSDATLWTVQSLGGNPATQTYHLPGQVSLLLNGKAITCAALNPQGFILPIPSCTTSLPGSTMPEWAILAGGRHDAL
jgi:prepilin-type N-terminal cleavage/methylation domain